MKRWSSRKYISFLVCKWDPVHKGQRETEGTDQSILVGGCKMSRYLHSTTRILKVYTEALTGFSHIYHPNDLNNTLLSQGCVLETAPSVGTVGVSPRTLGVGEESFIEPGPACRSTSDHVWVLMHILMHCCRSINPIKVNKCKLNPQFHSLAHYICT